MRGRAFASRRAVVAGLCATVLGCSSDFDTKRAVPPRGSVGRALYSLVCDRVGAQALREDVTGASFHGVCHADLHGAYAANVDASLLVPLDPRALDVDGKPVPLDLQVQRRAYRIARIEALGRRREDLIKAFDAVLPDVMIPSKALGAADPTASCDPDAARARLLTELADTLSRFIDLYNDDTIPHFTRALGHIMEDVRGDGEAQAALTRVGSRAGYRPSQLAMGLARPVLAYPRLVDLANSVLTLVSTDSAPYDPAGKIDPKKPLSVGNRRPIPGKASGQFQGLLRVAHEELRTTSSDPTPAPLVVTLDPKVAGAQVLSRPRTTLEIGRTLLLSQDDAFAASATVAPSYVVRRDARAFAGVPLVSGKLPAPFLDLTGPGGKADGLPDLDDYGRFVTDGAVTPPTPFYALGEQDGKRDAFGRALDAATGAPLYTFLDANRTFGAALIRDAKPLLDPDPANLHETVMGLLGGLPVILGHRDGAPTTQRTYPPDPDAIEAWKLQHPGQAVPPDVGKQSVTLAYDAFHPEDSPLVDLVYALGQIVTDPAVDDGLQLIRKLAKERPNDLARLVGLGLRMKAIADAHPEARLPGSSNLWDELLVTIEKLAHEPGILEDLIRAFGSDSTKLLDEVFVAYIHYRDVLTYNSKNLNGEAWNATTSSVSPLGTPVDRSQPDVGNNRSALQRFMQLLHDANGLGACTKEGAVAHVNWKGLKLDYPNDLTLKAACIGFGSSAPSKLPKCGVLRFENVDALLLDVALDRAKFDIRDDCLNRIANSPLTGIVGGVDKFLEEISGINGLSTHPTVNGIARLVYVDTPHDGLPGDTTPEMNKTVTFLRDIIDPVPSMACDPDPFTDKDGKVIPLRKCKSFADTLRGRDPNFLFPVETLNFVKNVRPLAAAFADHGQPMLFVDLFDTLHKHWGSAAQPKELCDPSLPKTDARWCAQDGAVSYEPLLVDMLSTDLFDVLYDEVKVLQGVKIQHCDAWDPTTRLCTKTSERDGVTVLADAVRVLVDPTRTPGLVDRQGRAYAVRNDGTHTAALSPLYLFLDALAGIDRSFDAWSAARPADAQRLGGWRSARSQLVDQFFQVKGTGAASSFSNPAFIAALPTLIDLTRAQVSARCPDRTKKCAWASDELVKKTSESISGPTFAATVDLLDAIRADPNARREIQGLLVYLLDAASANDAEASTLAALTDVVQVLDDDVNLSPIYRLAATATQADLIDPSGKALRRGLASAGVTSLARIFAAAYDAGGNEICAREIDPNRTIQAVLQNLITPLPTGETPLEIISSVVADVNRQDPTQSGRLAPFDYANIAKEISEFTLDPARGLEQVWVVIRQATMPKE